MTKRSGALALVLIPAEDLLEFLEFARLKGNMGR